MLPSDIKRGWYPIQEVVNYIHVELIKETDKVLDVGPGPTPLARADAAVDFIDCPNSKVFFKRDVCSEPLPFKDKEFDFVFARQILEDLYNPFLLLTEMQRVGKRGYIECPSPMAELAKGADATSPPFRGYLHHRWIVWVHDNKLHLVGKYPFAEYLRFDEERIAGMLRSERYWNSYYAWDGEIAVCHHQHPLDYVLNKQYAGLLAEAMEHSKASTDKFFSNFIKAK